MRRRITHLLAALGLGATLVFAPLAAQAEEPPRLGSSYVYDGAGVLSDAEEQAADDRLDALADETGLDLWVVYVADFDSPSDSAGWANATADLNGLGNDQYLLAIATEGRRLYLAKPKVGSISEAKLVAIEDAASTALADDDWAGAVDLAADEMAKQVKPNYTIWFVLGGIVVVAVIVVIAVSAAKRAKKRRIEQESRAALAAEVETFRTQATGLLLEMDDSLRTAEQEMGFATAQFGSDAAPSAEPILHPAAATRRLDPRDARGAARDVLRDHPAARDRRRRSRREGRGVRATPRDREERASGPRPAQFPSRRGRRRSGTHHGRDRPPAPDVCGARARRRRRQR
jgi:hypothetical protein